MRERENDRGVKLSTNDPTKQTYSKIPCLKILVSVVVAHFGGLFHSVSQSPQRVVSLTRTNRRSHLVARICVKPELTRPFENYFSYFELLLVVITAEVPEILKIDCPISSKQNINVSFRNMSSCLHLNSNYNKFRMFKVIPT
jgi:hypothetical protein